jgi:hypothetical protein
MKVNLRLLGAMVVALWAVSTLAQSPPVSTATELLSDGHVRFVVTNRSNQSITALAVVAEGTPLARGVARMVSRRFFDSVIDVFSEKDLHPRQDYVFVLAGPRPGPSIMRTDVTLKAALFADGTSWGDAAEIQHLVARRKLMLLYVNSALKTVQDAKTSGVARDILIQQMQASDGANSQSGPGVDERQIAHGVFTEVIGSLQLDGSTSTSALPLDQRLDLIISQLQQRQRRLAGSRPAVS